MNSMTNSQIVQARIDKQETTGISVIQSFFDQVFQNVPHQVVATYPGCRYDADVYDGDCKNHILIEIKERSMKYHPKYYDDMMFNIDKIDFALQFKDRCAYIYIAYYEETNEIYVLNIDSKGKMTSDNQSIMEGMPIAGFGYQIPPYERNKYGVYWKSGVMIKKTQMDDLSNKVPRERLYIPSKLFAHYQYCDGRWVKY